MILAMAARSCDSSFNTEICAGLCGHPHCFVIRTSICLQEEFLAQLFQPIELSVIHLMHKELLSLVFPFLLTTSLLLAFCCPHVLLLPFISLYRLHPFGRNQPSKYIVCKIGQKCRVDHSCRFRGARVLVQAVLVAPVPQQRDVGEQGKGLARTVGIQEVTRIHRRFDRAEQLRQKLLLQTKTCRDQTAKMKERIEPAEVESAKPDSCL